ncbi:MAG: serine hydrolase [Anaerolineaceae bacterium]|nr:serine hydrolase [Anaerolineaceae bacterium]
MRSRSSFIQWVSVGFLAIATLLLTMQLVRYSQIRAAMPSGLKIAGINVGGLSPQNAADRLNQIYLSPIELLVGKSRVQVKPAIIGYQLKLDNMLAAADKQRSNLSFWVGFWRFLWNLPISSEDIPLQYELDKNRVVSFLQNEIAPRYEQQAQTALPVPGVAAFNTNQGGTRIDPEKSLARIETAINSISNRVAVLEIVETAAHKPSFGALEYSMKAIIDESAYDGMIEIYLKDLQNGNLIHFTRRRNEIENTPVDVAYSSWSTIKIPILVSTFARQDPPYPQELLDDIAKMIEQSDNSASDIVAQVGVDKIRGPLAISEDMFALGLQNTFWAGYFKLGSPLLQAYKTPANERTDINTRPDPYAQTTPADLGMLLEDLYYCDKNYGGAFPIVFDGKISQQECRLMIDYLSKDNIGQLIQAGVPANTVVAHKHGWAVEIVDGYIHTMADSGIVYTKGGDYVLSIFAYHPVQAIFDVANALFADLASASYNYYNLELGTQP